MSAPARAPAPSPEGPPAPPAATGTTPAPTTAADPTTTPTPTTADDPTTTPAPTTAAATAAQPLPATAAQPLTATAAQPLTATAAQPPATAQALPATAEPPPDDLARLAEIARGAPTALALFSAHGALLAQNDRARATFGPASLADLFAASRRAPDLLAALRQRGNLSEETELATLGGPVWFLAHLRVTIDPDTGAPAVSLSAEDLTERRSAERAKDEFISIVNHELRTPLTAIRGAVGLLANGIVDDPPQEAELHEIAWENVLRLGRLVDDLLDVQRLRLGAVDLVIDRIELAPLVRETLDLLEPRAAEQGMTLHLAEPAPHLVVRADPGRIVQALSNLVTNAMKHAPGGTLIRVELQDLAAWARVCVHDQGPGVPETFRPRLFAPFSQADSTDARAGSGAGLGLYIVRTLIEAHGGSVGYDPQATRGSTFYFELPALPPTEDAPSLD